MATDTLRAAVQIAPKQTQIQEFELPEIPADAGILRVLRAGICGADVPGTPTPPDCRASSATRTSASSRSSATLLPSGGA